MKFEKGNIVKYTSLPSTIPLLNPAMLQHVQEIAIVTHVYVPYDGLELLFDDGYMITCGMDSVVKLEEKL